MKLGLSSYSFGWAVGGETEKMTPEILLETAYEYGIKLVQIADNMPLHGLSETELVRIRQMAVEKDVELELGIKGLMPEHLNRYIELCGFFGSKLLRVVTDTADYEPDLAQIIHVLKEIRPVAEEKGIVIAIENHDRFKSREYAQLIDTLDSQNIRICLDTANSMGASEGIDYVFSTLRPYVANLHIKDYVVKRRSNLMGFVVEGCPAGDGAVDIPNILENIKPDVNVILEMWATPEDSYGRTVQKEKDWVEQSIKYLRRYISD